MWVQGTKSAHKAAGIPVTRHSLLAQTGLGPGLGMPETEPATDLGQQHAIFIYETMTKLPI